MLKATANKLIAIRQVTQQNQGRRSPGIDKVIVPTAQARENFIKRFIQHFLENAALESCLYQGHFSVAIILSNKPKTEIPLSIPFILECIKLSESGINMT